MHRGQVAGELRPASGPGDNVGHQVSLDPVDDAGVDISHLDPRWNLGVPGTTIDSNRISHAPTTIRIRVGDDRSHACFDVQKDGIWLGPCNGA